MSKTIRELTQEEKDKVTELYNKKMKKKDICTEVHINYSSLKAFFDSNNMENRRGGIPKSFHESIFKLYNSGLTLKEIHDQYYNQFTVDQINYICREAGITRPNGKRVQLNHQYFSNITTQEQAYWLGFLTADGCVQHDPRKGNSWSIALSLMKEDKYLVEQFANDIETPLSVKEYVRSTGFQRQDGTPHTECRIIVYSTQMAEDLKQQGVIPKKSTILSQIAIIPNELYRHYIRGFFDGNGSATYYWNKKNTIKNPRIVFYSTNEFCLELRNKISEQLPNVFKPTITNQKKEQMSLFSYCRIEDVETLFDYMYSGMNDDLHYCKRKKEKLEELISEYRDNHAA